MCLYLIKVVAYFTMILDHIGFTFNESISDENYIYLRILGRIAFPLFAYAISIGFLKTRSVKKYAIRLFLWGIISQIPYYLFLNNSIPKKGAQSILIYIQTLITEIFSEKLNILFTFFFAILMLFFFREILKKNKENLKLSLVYTFAFLGVFVLVSFLNVDFGVYGLITVLIFYIARDNKLKMITLFTLLNLILLALFFIYEITIISTSIQIFSLISIMFIKGHNPQNDKPLPWKHALYALYPLHLLFLILLKNLI